MRPALNAGATCIFVQLFRALVSVWRFARYYPLVQFAQNLRGKLLLSHGTSNDNMHFQNPIAFATALIKTNQAFQTPYYLNRNHGIAGGNTRQHLYRQMTEFVKANL